MNTEKLRASDSRSSAQKHAKIVRMVMPGHVCPYGLKAVHLLHSRGFDIADVHLETREEVDAFKAAQDVKTTPQIFNGDQRIGGHDDLRRHLGLSVADPNAVSYQPVIALFSMSALLAIAAGYGR